MSFQELKKADPRRGRGDILLLRTMRRMSVDTFWSRDPVVESTLEENRKIETIGRNMGMHDVLPVMGQFLLKYTQEMGISVCILIHSLDKDYY